MSGSKYSVEMEHTVHSQNNISNFLSNWMEYDPGNSFPFNFEPNGITFG